MHLEVVGLGLGLALLLGGLVLRALGRHPALLDRPGPRSTHVRPVPRLGGVVVALALLAGLSAGAAFSPALRRALDPAWLVPAALYFGLGLADDLWRLRARTKFLGQAGIAAVAVALGLRWGGQGLEPFGALTFGALTPALTWLWLVATVILLNFLDGIDLITAATAAVLLAVGVGAGAGPGGGALYALTLGAVLGMAWFNGTPARLFPGDAGTHLLGFLVGSLALGHADGASAVPWPLAAAPLLPAVIDIFLGLVAKARHGVPLWAPHSEHLYQRLTKAGMSHARVALRYGALAGLAVLALHPAGGAGGWALLVPTAVAVLAIHLGGAYRATRHLPRTLGRGQNG